MSPSPLPSFPQPTTTTAFFPSPRTRFETALLLNSPCNLHTRHGCRGGHPTFDGLILPDVRYLIYPFHFLFSTWSGNLLGDICSEKFSFSDVHLAGPSMCARHARNINRSGLVYRLKYVNDLFLLNCNIDSPRSSSFFSSDRHHHGFIASNKSAIRTRRSPQFAMCVDTAAHSLNDSQDYRLRCINKLSLFSWIEINWFHSYNHHQYTEWSSKWPVPSWHSPSRRFVPFLLITQRDIH